MPWASSSPRTMLASTSDCVRKMTTRSAMYRHCPPLLHLSVVEGIVGPDWFDLEEDHRHVVVLRRVPNKRRHFAQHALAEFVGRQAGMIFENPAEPALAEAVVRAVHRLADAVGEEHAEVARRQVDRLLFEKTVEQSTVVELQSEHQPVGHEHLRLANA